MTQVEFAKALRVGEKNFARYEAGIAVQSYAMDNLLRVLEKHPETIHAFYSEWSEPRKLDNVFQIEAYKGKKRKAKIAEPQKVECYITAKAENQ